MKTRIAAVAVAVMLCALPLLANGNGILFGIPLTFNMQGDDSSTTFRFNLGNILAVNQSGYTIVDPSAQPASVHVSGCVIPGQPVVGPLLVTDNLGNQLPGPTAPPKNLPRNTLPGGGWSPQGNADGSTTWNFNYSLSYAPTARLNQNNQVTVTFPLPLPSTMWSGDPSNPSMPMACPVVLTVLYAGN